ncbi:hypothetical protein [Streptomyces cavernicola]|uniref:PH domain-containing protein n=1 Tax=Streptomyces cavernicola TaxID=3043613 RepID=A0ABT6SE43_9ACTN|nr:hypothetical protein [Streptomyces sp. B-S-A6]MDI3406467.1 hypothetical protein [Streptomyces sp. B-S-A6]
MAPHEGTVHDRHWGHACRSALVHAACLLGVLLLTDAGSGGLDPPRAALWTGLSVLLFGILTPPRVSAGHGWPAARGLLRERRVRTDRLVSVRWVDGVAQRLVLRELSRRVDSETARLLFKISDMK